jgi:membrane protein required for colicin V production
VTWLDFVIIALIALSAIFGVFRGFVREVLSLTIWVLSFWLASRYTWDAAIYLEAWIPYQDARLVATFVALFFAVLVIGMVISRLAVKLVRASGISGDRSLGAIFGLLRGVIIVALLVMVTAITPLAEDEAWRQSMLTGHFESLAAWSLDVLKSGLGEHGLLPEPVRKGFSDEDG